jgi:hypothetical protein
VTDNIIADDDIFPPYSGPPGYYFVDAVDLVGPCVSNLSTYNYQLHITETVLPGFRLLVIALIIATTVALLFVVCTAVLCYHQRYVCNYEQQPLIQ